MQDKPLVSVVIPCYNAEKYVEMAIRSIMNQTYTNLEILIIDDCSKDSTYEKLENLAKYDKRIILEKNEQNLKIVKTLNKLVLKANGKYIARMDADDISAPNRIEKQVNFLESNKDYGICGTNAWRIDCNNRMIGKSLLPTEDNEIKIVSDFFCVFYHPSVMIRSELYKKNLYREEYLYAEDMELWQRLLKVTKGKNLKEKLFYYRIISSSASNNSISGAIQKTVTNSLCIYSDYSCLLLLKNKRLIGLILWSKLQFSNDNKIRFNLKMRFCILLYILFRVYEKIIYKIIRHHI